MKNNKGLFSLIGFTLFLLGFTSLILSMVGIKLYPLLWLDYFSPVVRLLIRLTMGIGGIVLVFFARSDEYSHDDFFSEK
jgi:hypothetical protein